MKYTRIEILSEPDKDGKTLHFRYWMSDYHPGHPKGEHGWRERGQIFRTILPDKKEYGSVVDNSFSRKMKIS